MQNLIYAVIQLIHNLGATTVAGTAAAALWLARDNAADRHRLAILAALAWATQAASGASFGITTYYFDRQLPDIHGIAVVALVIKIVCAILGFTLALTYARRAAGWTAGKHRAAWSALLALAVVALSAAAFLRWFS